MPQVMNCYNPSPNKYYLYLHKTSYYAMLTYIAIGTVITIVEGQVSLDSGFTMGHRYNLSEWHWIAALGLIPAYASLFILLEAYRRLS
jgi:hypothetical protein